MVSAFVAAYDIRQMKRAIRAKGQGVDLPIVKLVLHAMDGTIKYLDAPSPPPARSLFLHVHAVDTDWYFEPLPPPPPQVAFHEGASIFDAGVGAIFEEQPEAPLKLVYMPVDVRTSYHATLYPSQEESSSFAHTSSTNTGSTVDTPLSPPDPETAR
ncbi:hypothetical protein [Phyllobacterium chamaecytisi]|uniref:hypothetical protein n=1 Tax=Phyllobacterium chamaecytisi TaxID=2876082 RepID=UPI001CCB7D42|nr:hypothetical protein [Phyllobacterium sp. KW56]MBZ9604870.1 hypothetical protein [Phyllobacterium sp. KW56]